MVVYPNAKINLGLSVLRKRTDGFHDIKTVMYPIGLKDILEIVPVDTEQDEGCIFSQSGLTIDGDASDNLCVQAYSLLKTAYDLPAVKIHLHKKIPFGAGLGGGSSDATFTLLLLNDLFSLNLSSVELKEYAGKLGSDCPFFVDNIPSLATGRGEILEPFTLSLKNYFFVLINPAIAIGTAEAYARINPHIPERELRSMDTDILSWKHFVTNDFEASIFPSYPQIAQIKHKLYECGALYASMTGSGSSVYGIFSSEVDLMSDFKGYFIHQEVI